MILSHWGIFPGWFVPASDHRGYVAYRFEPIDFDTYCLAVEASEDMAREMDMADAAEMRRAGRLH